MLSLLLIGGMIAQSHAAPTHLAECHNHCCKHRGVDLSQPLHDGVHPIDKEAEASFQKRYCFAEICQGLYCILCCGMCPCQHRLQTQPTEPITEVSLLAGVGLLYSLIANTATYALFVLR